MNNTDIQKTKDSHSRLGMLLMVFVITIGVVFLAMMLWHSFIPVAEHKPVDVVGIAFSFVGILATFIVIGNYAQVSDIRGEVRREIAEIYKAQRELDCNISSQIDKIQAEQTAHTKKIQELVFLHDDFENERLRYRQDISNRNTKFILETFGEFLQLSQQDLILFQRLYKNPDGITLDVSYKDGSNKNVVMKISEGQLVIDDSGTSIKPEDVVSVNHKKHDLSKLSNLIRKTDTENMKSSEDVIDSCQDLEQGMQDVNKNNNEQGEFS